MFFVISNILILIVLTFFFLKNKKFKKLFKFMLITWSILLALELTVFNFRFYQSQHYVEFEPEKMLLKEGMHENPDGTFSAISESMNAFEFTDIYKHLENIYVDLEVVNPKEEYLSIAIGYTDAANRRYSYTQKRLVKATKDKGEIIKLYLAGKSGRIKLYVNAPEDIKFKINKISFNKPYEFNVSLIRMSVLYLIIMLIYVFRPKSSLYKIKLSDKKAINYIKGAFIIQLALFSGIFTLNKYFLNEDFAKDSPQRNQYQMLTEALLDGQVYLKEQPSDILKELKNPYDRKARKAAMEENNSEYLWDVAYYKGKYYVYFGVMPVLTYYMPYYLITGSHIKTSSCIFITMFITLIGIFFLLRKITLKWFKNTSLGLFLLFTFMFINGCGIMSIMGRPDHYSLPIFMAIMFSVYGLICWLKASETNKLRYFALGSLFMACISACRPQLLVTSMFAIPIFWDYISKDMFKKHLKKIIAFVLPYIIIALLVMAYNYIRFGSPFDFGANYNLTTNDMTRRGFILFRIPLGIYYYLINPAQISLTFPFVGRSAVLTNYMGTTIYEKMCAGLIPTNFLLIFGLGIFKYRNDFKDKMPYRMAYIAVISALILIITDTEMAGILPRYVCDFGFLLYLSTFIVLLTRRERIEKSSFWHKIVLALIMFMFIYNLCFLFSDNAIMKSDVYFHFRNLFEFWV